MGTWLAGKIIQNDAGDFVPAWTDSDVGDFTKWKNGEGPTVGKCIFMDSNGFWEDRGCSHL